MRMTRREFIDALQENTEKETGYRWSKADCLAMIKIFSQTVREALESGRTVQILNFGEFGYRIRPEINCKHPETKADICIPAAPLPFFKACEGFRKEVKERVKIEDI